MVWPYAYAAGPAGGTEFPEIDADFRTHMTRSTSRQQSFFFFAVFRDSNLANVYWGLGSSDSWIMDKTGGYRRQNID